MARYVAALLGGGTGEHGSVLKPETLAPMFEPHYQLDPRVPGMGLGFLLGEEGGHRTVGHDGILPGFLSQLLVAPDDGIGLVVITNTGGLDGRGAPDLLGSALLRRLLGLPEDAVRADVPAHPEIWSEVCGWYGPDSGPLTNLQLRVMLGAGAEVMVQRGHLMLRPLSPIPAMGRGLRLYPDDDHDPYVFRIDLWGLGKGTLHIVFISSHHVISDVLSRFEEGGPCGVVPWGCLLRIPALGARVWRAVWLWRARPASLMWW